MCVLKKRYLHLYEIYGYTAVPLTVRGMEWDPLPETVCRMAGIELLQNLHFPPSMVVGAASERTWTYLQRVSGNGSQFIYRIRTTLVNACYISLFR